MGLRWAPDWLLRGIGRAGFQTGMDVDLGEGRIVKTDGLSSIGKVRTYEGRLVVIYGDDDDIMPVRYADEFEAAYHRGGVTRIQISGGTHTDTRYLRDEQSMQRLRQGLGIFSRLE